MGSMELINHYQSVSWKCKSIHFKTSCSTLTQTQKMFEVAGNSGNHLIQSPCSRQVTWSWLPRTVPICFLMCLRMETLQLLWATCAHCSVTHTAKKTHFLMFRGTLLCFSVCFSQKCGVAVFSVNISESSQPLKTALLMDSKQLFKKNSGVLCAISSSLFN